MCIYTLGDAGSALYREAVSLLPLGLQLYPQVRWLDPPNHPPQPSSQEVGQEPKRVQLD